MPPRMNKHTPIRKLSLLCLLALGLALPTTAAPSPTALTAPALKLLKSQGYPVLAATYLPKGYAFDEVRYSYRTGQSPGSGPKTEIIYRCQCDQQSIIIQAGTGGFGGPGGDEEFTLSNPQLGKVTLMLFKVGGQLEIKQPYYLTSWSGKGPLYFSLLTGDGVLDNDLPPPSRAEISKVVQSLRYLK